MIEQLRYVIVLTTSKGEFFWNSNSKFDYLQTMGVKRTWGWVSDVKAAQHYQKPHAASLQADSLTVDIGRLFEGKIGIKAVTLRFDKRPLPAEIQEVQPEVQP